MSRQKIDLSALGQYHEYGIYTPARLLFLGHEITLETTNQFIKNIRMLDHMGSDDITVQINSPGGEVHQGLAVYDSIRSCNSRVITKIVGEASSMASVIAQAGDHRIINENGIIMVHIGEAGYDSNHPEIIKRWANEYARLDKVMQNIIFERIKEKKPKFTKKKLKDLLLFDSILTSKQALEYGLVDKIEENN